MPVVTARQTHPAGPTLSSVPTVPPRQQDGVARSPRPRPAVTARFPLPAPAWSQWHDVLVPAGDSSAGPAVTVVLGPTGVHVVTHHGADAESDSAPWPARASAAAAAVEAALPFRYRGTVTAALVDEAAGDGHLVDGVVVATTTGLVESIRLRPRVLSRSETGVLAGMLSRLLVPRETEVVRPGLWGRLTRWSRTSRGRAA